MLLNDCSNSLLCNLFFIGRSLSAFKRVCKNWVVKKVIVMSAIVQSSPSYKYLGIQKVNSKS